MEEFIAPAADDFVDRLFKQIYQSLVYPDDLEIPVDSPNPIVGRIKHLAHDEIRDFRFHHNPVGSLRRLHQDLVHLLAEIVVLLPNLHQLIFDAGRGRRKLENIKAT
jgi:hypothetical protein